MTTNSGTWIDAAMKDAEDLLPWAKPNDAVLQFGHLAQTLRKTLGGPVQADCEFGVPLLRIANSDAPATPLVRAVVNWVASCKDTCDFCLGERPSGHRLAVLAGASAVLFHFCPRCRDVMDEVFTGLHWEG